MRMAASAGVIAALAAALSSGGTVVEAQPPRTPAAQDEFVPVSELPEAEQLPAAPLLLTAYAFFWAAAFVYLWFIRRRMAAVDRELAQLRQRLAETTRRPLDSGERVR
jgi:CcmD family protein